MNISRNTLAVIGAGPVGLEAALCALERGFDVHVFERGEVGAHPIAWGHVRMFTPWRLNLGPTSVAHLERGRWTRPDDEAFPTGAELARLYLEPLGRVPAFEKRVHTHAQVVHVSRRGALKADVKGRREHPFRLMVRDAGGRESYLHAHSLIDASGVYGQPNWAGDGGIPARQELALAPQMIYHLDDVLGARRSRYAGKRTLVIGAGASAATAVTDLTTLAREAAGTSVVWVTRKPAGELYPTTTDDPLPQRRALWTRARELAGGSDPAVTVVGGAVLDELGYNSAVHRYRVTLRVGDSPRLEEVDQVIVHAGFGPDDSIYRELQVEVPALGVDRLADREPDFYLIGAKSYGRDSSFLLETGYRQAADVVEKLAIDHGVPALAVGTS